MRQGVLWLCAVCFVSGMRVVRSAKSEPAACNRRTLLGYAATAALTVACPALADIESQVLQYDETGKLVDTYSDVTQFRTLREGATSVQMLSAWRALEDGSYEDPTLGIATKGVRMMSTATALASTEKLGRPENVNLVSALGLEKELERADLVAAAVRKAGGTTFYDFDLALPARKCNAELATACLPELVILISCGITGGMLHVVRVDARADEWKRSGTALRLLRSSFAVAS